MFRSSLLEHFSALDDPRQRGKVLCPLPEIMLLVLCATLAGAEDFVEIRHWGRQKLDTLARPLALRARHSVSAPQTKAAAAITAMSKRQWRCAFPVPGSGT